MQALENILPGRNAELMGEHPNFSLVSGFVFYQLANSGYGDAGFTSNPAFVVTGAVKLVDSQHYFRRVTPTNTYIDFFYPRNVVVTDITGISGFGHWPVRVTLP